MFLDEERKENKTYRYMLKLTFLTVVFMRQFCFAHSILLRSKKDYLSIKAVTLRVWNC